MKLCANVERAALVSVLMVLCCGCAVSAAHAQDMQPMDAKPADEQPGAAPMDSMDSMAPATPAKRDVKKPDAATSPGAADAERDPLAGPKVDDPAARTLVRYDMQNRLQRVDVRPEEAALRLLELDENTRERARGVVLDRADALRVHLAANIELVKEFAEPAIAKDNAKTAEMAKQLFERFDPQRQLEPMAGPLASVLSAEEHARLMTLVREYWEAWIASEQKSQPKLTREQIVDRLAARAFASEVQRLYDSALRPAKQKMDAIANAVEASDEQRGALRLAFIAYIREGKLRPTEEHRAALARAIYGALTEEQRVKLVQQSLTAI